MLTQATAQDLGLKGNFSHFSLTLPSFLTNSPLWQKDKSSIINSKKAKRFQFYKYGKNLGMEVIRYLEYYNGRLFYFENANDKESKGECVIENLYFYYFSLGKNFVMHLTNGQQHSTFYFHDNNFFSTYYNQIIKYVIQIDFNERYQLLEQIGQGTFSKVYYGMNKFTNRTFAIKIMPKMDETGFSTKSLACQEKKVLKFTKTDHLCGMEQFFQDNFNYIFVLQFIGGQDLSKILKQQKIMSTNENIFILKQVLKGLKELHELNIIHRDLKPHNIIIDSKQRLVKIVDFGLSLLVDSRTTLNQYMRCGTMGYIAPQIVNNQASNRKSYNCQSDMFAFGIIAHMLLQGTNPMRARTYKDTVDRNINCNFIINDKQILISYGRDCLELIKGCLNKDPQLRPTAKEALDNIFFQEKQLDEKTVTNKDLNEEQVFGNKISELNYLEDKQVIGDKQISSKNFNASQICTPKKTIQTGHSMSSRSKISGFSGIM